MKSMRNMMGASLAAAVLAVGAAGVAVASGGTGGWFGDQSAAAAQAGGGQFRGGGMGGPGGGAGKDQSRGAGQGQGAGAGTGECQGAGDCLTADPAVALTQEQAATLVHMREEEQLAHDLYVEFGALWDSQVFDRVAASESRHLSAVQRMLDRYGLADPSPGAGFADDGLQALWDELLAKGQQSQEAALEAARMVEEADIKDLQAALDAGQPADVAQVYRNLLAGSQRHLKAFGG